MRDTDAALRLLGKLRFAILGDALSVSSCRISKKVALFMSYLLFLSTI